jgi:GDPmannose 4,6-dehydratase
MAVAKIALGKQDVLYLGNLNSKRDWGHAKDYVEGMYLMLQQEVAEDYVLSTGITTTVKDFIILAFKEVGVELKFEGIEENEVAKIAKCNGDFNLPIGKVVIKVDPLYYRKTEVDILIGDSSKARKQLNWEPKYNLIELVKEMVANDLKLLR